jgi:hypothetical protein
MFFILTLGLFISSSLALADEYDTTCSLLGRIGECENVSICTIQRASGCFAKPTAPSHEWVSLCPRAGVNIQACGWQPFCEWRSDDRCVARR